MNRLVSIEDIRAIKPLSGQAKENLINPIIEDVQIGMIKPWLGNKLFNLVLNDPSEFTTLLEPHVYDNGEQRHEGLKRVIIELVWANYLFNSADTSTPFGVVEKNFEDGRKISREREKELRTRRHQITTMFWFEVKRFIFVDETLKELFSGTERQNRTFKQAFVKRTPWL